MVGSSVPENLLEGRTLQSAGLEWEGGYLGLGWRCGEAEREGVVLLDTQICWEQIISSGLGRFAVVKDGEHL